MKHTILFAALLLGAGAAHAADAAKSASASAAASADGATSAESSAQARAELAELRAQMQEMSRRMARLSSELGESSPRSYALRYLGDPDRAMIGVVLAKSGKGVRISAVTPDGPAARAGLRDGDVITAIDGKRIEDASDENALDRARAMLGDLKENQSVTLNYRRGSSAGVVTFNAERREPSSWAHLFATDPEHPFLPKDFDKEVRAEVERAQREATRAMHDKERMRGEVERAQREARAALKGMDRNMGWRFAMPWWGLNLASLNPDLGHYFGTDHGVLVLSTDEESLPGLRAGDVIKRIAGEKVGRPEDALRALRDQAPGEKVPIEILREKKTIALEMKTPAFKSIFNLGEIPPVPPVPPAPPATPAPRPAAAPAPAAVPAPAVPAPPSPPDPARTEG